MNTSKPGQMYMRRFVIIGQRASASPEFSLIDLAGTSGRLDVLLRCLRAALLVSHGLRRDTTAYLVLLGGELAPRTLRFDGAGVKFLRPDERSLAVTAQKALAVAAARAASGAFQLVRPGIAVAARGLEAVLDDVGDAPLYVLEEGGPDLRGAELDPHDPVLFIGDHLGFGAATRERLERAGAKPIGLGPVSVHAEDAVTILVNELDRRGL